MADELLVNFGGGPQPGSDQTNTTAGVDYLFFSLKRSERSTFHIGASYTYFHTNTSEFDTLQAFSLFPQMSLYPTPNSWVRGLMPDGSEPYFYVRFLGPTYMSEKMIGDRIQTEHFTFQAQIGVGAIIHRKNNTDTIISLSYKHFSNANLFSENDGFDLPVVLNIGIRF